MEIRKATWQSSADHLHLAMPFTKVDVEKRLVHGFASLDNIDEHDDVVMADASSRAFARFRGNIREMHQPIAAGRMLDFYEDVYYDPSENAFHKGIVVTAYISTGAESTWQKVLDGTLSGFSIGGNILESDTEFDKSAGKPVRFIKEYELYELSLVDNPANQLANIFSIEKAKDGSAIVKGLAVDTKIENVFYCGTDNIARTSAEESLVCPNCGNAMENAGWIEANGSDRETSLKEAVEKYLSKQVEPAHDEGGVDVADSNEELPEAGSAVPAGETDAVEQGQAETEADASVEEVTATDESSEEAADVSEVDDADNSIAKMLDDLKSSISKTLEANAATVNESIEDIRGAFTKSFGEVESRIADLADKYGDLSKRVEGLKSEISDVEKSVSGIEKATATKKSGDLGGSTEDTVLEKSRSGSFWGGQILS